VWLVGLNFNLLSPIVSSNVFFSAVLYSLLILYVPALRTLYSLSYSLSARTRKRQQVYFGKDVLIIER